MNSLKRILSFHFERFSPLTHGVMISIYVIAHAAFASYYKAPLTIWLIVKAFLLTYLFFFQLRCFDEIKDYETDIKINPDRPLPRGSISLKELHLTIFFCVITELTLSFPRSFFPTILTLFYSFLMFKEFFIGKYLRPHLTTYAVTHTFVTIFLSWSLINLFCVNNGNNLSREIVGLSFLSWAVFNIFEFSRKSFLEQEEKENVVTYSSLFGKIGAFFLTLSQFFFALICLYQISFSLTPFFINYLFFLGILLILVGLYYSFSSHYSAGVVFRSFGQMIIVAIYLGMLINLFILNKQIT